MIINITIHEGPRNGCAPDLRPLKRSVTRDRLPIPLARFVELLTTFPVSSVAMLLLAANNGIRGDQSWRLRTNIVPPSRLWSINWYAVHPRQPVLLHLREELQRKAGERANALVTTLHCSIDQVDRRRLARLPVQEDRHQFTALQFRPNGEVDGAHNTAAIQCIRNEPALVVAYRPRIEWNDTSLACLLECPLLEGDQLRQPVRFCCNKDFGLRRYAIDSELAGARRYR